MEIIENVLSLSEWELYLRREISASNPNLWKEAELKGTFMFGKETGKEKEFSITLMIGTEAWMLYLESGYFFRWKPPIHGKSFPRRLLSTR